MQRKGIDVSHHNGVVDWKRVKESGVEFAMIRAGYGWDDDSQIDRQFKANASGCLANGIPFGFYHYSYAMSAEDAAKEAKWFLRVIRDYKPEYPVAFDFEEAKQLALPLDRQLEIIGAFMDAVKESRYYAALYMTASSITRLHRHAPGTMSLYDAWVAHWGASSADYPGSFGMWQYDVSGVGVIPGITGKCDVNYAYVDYPRVVKSNGLNGWEKPAPPTPSDDTAVRQQYEALLGELRALIAKYDTAE